MSKVNYQEEEVYYNVKYFADGRYHMAKTPAKSFGEAESNVYFPGAHIVNIKRTRVKPRIKPL